ncbi:hypothetical protein Dimus_017077 [Dionaea muscipula]
MMSGCAQKEITRKHFVLVHGSCHGAWSWYKLIPLLKAAGHRVTAVDLAASGINTKSIHEVEGLRHYTEPLLDLLAVLPPEEKVVLVGHSYGGMSLALAADNFPQKIDAAIFVSAFMPDTVHPPSHVLDQLRKASEEYWLDTEFICNGNPEDSLTTMFFGLKFMAKLYELSPLEDLELGMMLKRPTSLFVHELSKANKFSEGGYGSVKRVYVVCKQDKAIPETFQRWMIDNGGAERVMELEGADHMPMLCIPQQLCDCLVDIVKEELPL